MWLVNELVLTFWAPVKYTKTPFNPIILYRVTVFIYDKQKNTSVKTDID